MLRSATYVRPAPNRLDVPTADAAPTVRRASFEVVKAPAPVLHIDVADLKPAEKAKPKAEPIRLAARDPLPRSLLPADISTLAAREAKGAKDSSKAAR